MRYLGLIVFFLIPCSISAESTANAQADSTQKAILIRNLEMDGFVLGDKERFVKLFKPYRNKYLTTDDMDSLLKRIQLMYEREGYQQLVTISYQVTKHRLVFTVLMTT